MSLVKQTTKPELNEKEQKILQLICNDQTTKEIASDLKLSPRTIETIRDKLKTKFDVKSVGALVYQACKHKMVNLWEKEPVDL